MESTSDISALSHELFDEFARLGRNTRPDMRNATRGEMGVIRILHNENGPLTPSEISDRAHISPARVANVLRALEEKGWVAREHSREDLRRVTVTLTEAGDAERMRRRAQFEAHAEAFLAKLGEADTREAIRILSRANQILEDEKRGEAQ